MFFSALMLYIVGGVYDAHSPLLHFTCVKLRMLMEGRISE
jgi:hypothetical protein